MATDFHVQVRGLLDEAAARRTAERTAFIRRAAAGRTSVLREALSLLPHYLGLRSGLRSATPNPAAALRTRTWHAAADELVMAPPFSIPPYAVVELLGCGGMGVVYRAVDRLHRQVAIKLLRTSMASAEQQRRFKHEEELLRQLRHPGIVRFLHGGCERIGGVGRDGGPPPVRSYIVMELVRGLPLVSYAEARRLSAIDRLRMFLQVCRAVEHAHIRGVVHRDLKPDNILVTGDGRPKILDFGIARLEVEDPIAPPQPICFVGTPAYASPEQRAGRTTGLTAESDVYTLGLILHELLTGRLPQRSGGKLRLSLRAVQLPGEPDGSLAQREFRGALLGILATALRAPGARRFLHAGELAGEIDQLLGGLTRPTGWRGLVARLTGLMRYESPAAARPHGRLLAVLLRNRVNCSVDAWNVEPDEARDPPG